MTLLYEWINNLLLNNLIQIIYSIKILKFCYVLGNEIDFKNTVRQME